LTLFLSRGILPAGLPCPDAAPCPRPPLPRRRARSAGPSTPAGKARSAQNALKHGLRAATFTLLPGEGEAGFATLLERLRRTYGPEDGSEAELVEAIAAAFWQAGRADRLEAEALVQLAPGDDTPPHGGRLAEQAGPRAALGTVIRYQGHAQNGLRRALDAFLKHRKAKRDGLFTPLEAAAGPEPANDDAPPPAPETGTGEIGTNEFPRPALPVAAPLPAPPEPVEAPVLPFHVEPDPEDEAKRQALLAALDDPGQRQRWANHPLWLLEHRAAVVDPDPAVYEAWFARQPKPDFPPVELSAEDRAAIDHVTRHNPPWLKGDYLGYYRPPVPRALFEAEAEAAPEPVPEAPAPREDARAALRARVERLLDRTLPRQADELDLAEAVCALKWPKWPAYRGGIDLGLLRRVLEGCVIDSETLHWLGGKEIERACRAATTSG
jgi:hypothetical protein